MIHPDTVVRTVSELIGNGVFATKFIPHGTIMVVRDAFDLCVPLQEFRQLPLPMQNAMENYMYHDKSGHLILSWDHARYMNHNCNSNTLMTDYNLEIAVADIYPGEEITADYGILNVQEPYELFCNCTNCRGVLRKDDIDSFADLWDNKILESLLLLETVPQPLICLLPEKEKVRLKAIYQKREMYSSVKSLKFLDNIL